MAAGRAITAGITRFVRWVLGHRGSAQPGTWVLTREGPVCFLTHGTILVSWDAVGGVRPDGDGARIELTDVPVRTFAHPGPVPIPRGEARVDADGMGDLPRDVFVERLAAALADPAVRKGLPTFAHPDGPPEAVLAGLTDL